MFYLISKAIKKSFIPQLFWNTHKMVSFDVQRYRIKFHPPQPRLEHSCFFTLKISEKRNFKEVFETIRYFRTDELVNILIFEISLKTIWHLEPFRCVYLCAVQFSVGFCRLRFRVSLEFREAYLSVFLTAACSTHGERAWRQTLCKLSVGANR